jgi:SAM-dependent methyltransferase
VGEPNYFMPGHHHRHDPRTDSMRDPLAPVPGPDHAHPGVGILPGMAESSGAVSGLGESSIGIKEDDAALIARRVGAAIQSPPPPMPPEPGSRPVSPLLAQGLERMSSRADLFGFAITPRRPVVGMRNLKRLLRRLQAQTFTWQSEFNDAATSVARVLASEEHGARGAVHAQAMALTSVESRLSSLESRLLSLQDEHAMLLERLERQRPAPAATPEQEVIPELDYFGLQVRFRGDENEIAERQRLYVEYLSGGQNVLDIGCGRGEFLGLLRDAGIEAQGVDSDADMVALCQARGLDVALGDGLAHLKAIPDETLGGVFAAQVIEHLTPAQVITLMRTAYGKLRPGGVLILETVNPASVVALTNFYLDFTHVKPIHPLALEWLAESLEFTDRELLYLSLVQGGPRLRPLPAGVGSAEEAKAFDDAAAATNEVLYGPRDYALVARRR